MKKFFTFIAVAAMAFAAQAATLTVAEGTERNAHYPFYALYYDTQGTTSQVIYPASELTELVGCEITSLEFTATSPIALRGGSLEYALDIVSENEFATANAIELSDNAVYGHCAPVNGETTFVIELDEPFLYEGGNLLLQTVVETAGNYATVYFYGQETGLVSGFYQYSGWSGVNKYSERFLPMTTFTYEEGAAPVEQTEAPSIAADTQQGVHAYFVTITPSEECDLYYRYAKDNGEWSEWTLYDAPIPFEEDGYYEVEAYAIAADKAESLHVSCSFTVTPRTGLYELNGDKAVSSVRYFNAAGQEMQQANGLTIVVTTYTDGTTSAVKVIK